MQEHNTKELIDPKNFKFKNLIYAPPGFGKTDWACDPAIDPGVAACETGVGNGLLTVAGRGLPYGVLSSLTDLEAFCGGANFKTNHALVLDGGSEAVRTFIKDYALTLPNPRAGQEQARRSAGVPIGNDYQSMAEIMRRNLRKLLSQDKHIIVTALEKVDRPGENDPPGTPTYIGPELPGQLLLSCTAMFDFVFRLKVRNKLRDPNNPKSRYLERYLVTESMDGMSITKCRSQISNKPLLDQEEIVDKESGRGYPGWLIEKIKSKYAEELAKEGKCS
jgi:hypothetical protein